MTRSVITIPLAEITPEQAMAAGELLAKVWPRPDRGPKERANQLLSLRDSDSGTNEKAAQLFLIYDKERIIAHTLVFERIIQTQSGPRSIMALAMVATDADYRGQGLGALMVRSAFALVDRGIYESALFQTSRKVQPFYEAMGATKVENQIINSIDDEKPNECPFRDELVMRYPANQDWPEGVIDLKGPGY